MIAAMRVDATIVIPTHDHAALLPYALRSALGQTASVEIFVIGDGVGDDTREALGQFLTDHRVRFFDNPKGERLGEAHRHVALREATGEIVTYLSDDDILLPDHVTTMQQLLDDADFAHPAPALIDAEGRLEYVPFDASRDDCRTLLLLGDENSIGLTGTSHTLALYRRLPHGWRPAPPGVYTDWHMWKQIFGLDDLIARTGDRLTYLHFPSRSAAEFSVAERVAELDRWETSAREPGFASELATLLNDAIRRSAEDARLMATRRRAHLLAIHRRACRRLRQRLRSAQVASAARTASLQLGKRAESGVPLRRPWDRRRATPARGRGRPSGSRARRRGPLAVDRVEMQRGLAEVEAVGHPWGDDDRHRIVASQLDPARQPFRYRVGSQIVECDDRGSIQHRQIVRVGGVHVHSAKDVRGRADDVHWTGPTPTSQDSRNTSVNVPLTSGCGVSACVEVPAGSTTEYSSTRER